MERISADLSVNAVNESGISVSDAQALANIVEWSKDCPKWQRDALRRLCIKDDLDDVDLDELTAPCIESTRDWRWNCSWLR